MSSRHHAGCYVSPLTCAPDGEGIAPWTHVASILWPASCPPLAPGVGPWRPLLAGSLALLGLSRSSWRYGQEEVPAVQEAETGQMQEEEAGWDGVSRWDVPGGRCIPGNRCPDGQKPCGTACILAGQCCTSTDCPSGTTCCNHLCTDTMTDPRHCGGCPTACSAGKTCAGGRCCTGRGDDCTTAGECCGTDFCNLGPGDRVCRACVPKDGECRFKTCCPGLFCVFQSATNEEKCVSCKPTG